MLKILIIRLRERRMFNENEYHLKTKSILVHLIDMILIDLCGDVSTNDVKWILNLMPNLNQLTLSAHDTFNSGLSHGPYFESILNECVPNLRQLNITMTHLIEKAILVEDFLRWPMVDVYYGSESYSWIDIYSLPWPSSRNDKRTLPIDRYQGSKRSVTSDVRISHYTKRLLVTNSNNFLK